MTDAPQIALPSQAALIVAFLASSLVFAPAACLAAPSAPGGDVFRGSAATPSRQLGSDPSACKDNANEIGRIEQQTGTTARVFPVGTSSASLGRRIETSGYVPFTGVCVGEPGSVIEFISNNRIGDANKIADEVFSASGPGPGPSDRQAQPNYADTDQNVKARCAMVLYEQGNLDNFPSCVGIVAQVNGSPAQYKPYPTGNVSYEKPSPAKSAGNDLWKGKGYPEGTHYVFVVDGYKITAPKQLSKMPFKDGWNLGGQYQLTDPKQFRFVRFPNGTIQAEAGYTLLKANPGVSPRPEPEITVPLPFTKTSH